jgi:hypothetical protein
MSGKIRVLTASVVLTLYVLCSSGCAVAWFIAGAGAAATAITVADDNSKKEAKKK